MRGWTTGLTVRWAWAGSRGHGLMDGFRKVSWESSLRSASDPVTRVTRATEACQSHVRGSRHLQANEI